MKALVIGEICEDIFHYGIANRINPESHTPIFTPHRIEKNDGMAANVAHNLNYFGVDVDLIRNDQKKQIQKVRYVDEKTSTILFRVDFNDKAKVMSTKALHETLTTIGNYDFIIISDYNKGFLTENCMEVIFENHPFCFLDTKRKLGEWSKQAKFIKLNEKEAFENIDYSYKSQLIITLAERGCVHMGDMVNGEKVEVKNVAGAGDTFLAAFASDYMNNYKKKKYSIINSMKYANKYAAKAVQQSGVVSNFE